MAIIKRSENEFVDTDEIEDPACTSLEAGDPYDVFRDYMFPRIEAAAYPGATHQDEASIEVLAAMDAGRNFADAVLDTIESLPESETKKLRAWSQEARGTHIYPYVQFSGDHVKYGLMLTTGGPEDDAIAYEKIDDYWLRDDFAEFHLFLDAFRAIVDNYPKHMFWFEEHPLVEIKGKKDYEELISEMNHESSGWDKPGLYDFRDEPPSYAGTVESYIRSAKEAEAEAVLSQLDTGQIKDTCALLLERSSSSS